MFITPPRTCHCILYCTCMVYLCLHGFSSKRYTEDSKYPVSKWLVVSCNWQAINPRCIQPHIQSPRPLPQDGSSTPRTPREEKRVRNWMDGGTVIRFCSNPMRSQWQCVDLNSPGSVYLLSSNYSCLYIQMWFLAAVWVFSRDRQTKRSTLIAHLHPRV